MRHSAIEILRRQEAEEPQLQRMGEQERVKGQVAELVYQARKRAGLTQAELAKRDRYP